MVEQHAPRPLPAPPIPQPRPRQGRKGRPFFGVLIGVAILTRVGREVAGRVAISRYGLVGLAAVAVGVYAVVLLWRAHQRARARARGTEFTPELVTRQLADSGIGQPAFPESGTLLGASVLVMNQHAKILEVNTDYEVFGSAGLPIGSIRQFGQSRGKALARVVTGLDQFFTHHFEICDSEGRPVLRLTRPRKVFLTRLHVFDGADRFVGTIRQRNVFWKIRFALLDAGGAVVGHLRAENVRAWDFHIYDGFERCIATVVKSWEGWARTAFTRADHYVVRVHVPLVDPLRQLTLAAALATDLALKQDARGIT